MDPLTAACRRLAEESEAAYAASRFSALSRDFTSRFSRDPAALGAADHVAVGKGWSIVLPAGAPRLAARMAERLGAFLSTTMGEKVPVRSDAQAGASAIELAWEGGGDPGVPESFTLHAAHGRVRIAGRDLPGLRDGVIRAIHEMGQRAAPVLALGETTYRPRLAVRLGAVPWLATPEEALFYGYNAAWVTGAGFFELSTSDALPELARLRVPAAPGELASRVRAMRELELLPFMWAGTPKFDHDDPVFRAHPEVRGARTWKADGLHVLCTEHPLVRRYLAETVQGIFRCAPGLRGLVIIVGGEGFYHCFMRPYGAEKGHTTCPRCEAVGPAQTVANLVNGLAAAAREVSPEAVVLAWPYSAAHVWSLDPHETPFIERLRAGAGLFTEMEKDEFVTTAEGVRKHLWDYSVHLIGPGERARHQLATCLHTGVPAYVKSEPELSFEAPRLPHVPCLDLWLRRAEALATCGAAGAFVFPAFRPLYGASSAECYRLAWWDPAPGSEEALCGLAERIAGPRGGAHLRKAWRLCSEAVLLSPELPSYYTGPYYLGPAHPMCCDPEAELPRVFYGQYLFRAEATPEEGLELRPTFIRSPREEDGKFERSYRRMEALLAEAARSCEAAAEEAPERCRLQLDAECSSIRWFYRTARTHANFYESCRLRDLLLAGIPPRAAESALALEQWRRVLEDELRNTEAALPLMEADMRLDWYYGGDHTFPHGVEMLRAKRELLRCELDTFLPAVAARLIPG